MLVRAREHLIAAAVLGAAVALYLWPALFGGDVLSPAALLYDFSPWIAHTPADKGDYYNNFVSDNALQFLPWQEFARDSVRNLDFPAWNPYVLGGAPFFANAQVAILSPFTWPLYVLPFEWALGFTAALKLWVAGFGAYLLVREFGLGFWAGLLAGVAYAFCAFDIVWLSHPHTNVAPLLPWALW